MARPFFDKAKYDRILELQKRHIIGQELMPEHDGFGGSIWRFEVLKPSELPPDLKAEYDRDGEITV